MKTAFVFPGQGSQSVAMGTALAEAYGVARDIFLQIDAVLGEPLSELMREGPAEILTLTQNAQPALMAHSLAVVRVLETHGIRIADHCAYVAGHSLGEYSALAAANVIGIAETARLLRIRGQAMQAAVGPGQGAMAAVLGLDEQTLTDVIARHLEEGVCQVANDNAPGQVVVSGHKHAVKRCVEAAKEAGAKRAILLPVSAPFHCALMQPAATTMEEALSQVPFAAPVVPVVCNVTARATSDQDALRANLVTQITGTVRWRESMQWLVAQGVERIVEVGTGKVLAGLMRRIERKVEVMSIATPEDVDAFVQAASHH